MYAFRRLLPFLRPYRWLMAIVIVSAAIITAVNLTNPWLVRELIQNIRVDAGDEAINRIIFKINQFLDVSQVRVISSRDAGSYYIHPFIQIVCNRNKIERFKAYYAI